MLDPEGKFTELKTVSSSVVSFDYSLSTLVFDAETRKELGLAEETLPHPFKTCIVLGHVTDKEGKKESRLMKMRLPKMF